MTAPVLGRPCLGSTHWAVTTRRFVLSAELSFCSESACARSVHEGVHVCVYVHVRDSKCVSG